MFDKFFEKNLTFRIVIGFISAVLLSFFIFYILYVFSPTCNGLNGLQLLAKSTLSNSEILCVLYTLSIETICIFLIPAYIILFALYRKPSLILRNKQYALRESRLCPIIFVIFFVILSNIPGINLLSQINTNGVLAIIGEDSTQWLNYQRMTEFTEMLIVNCDYISLNILCMAIIPAVCEEIFFRGFLQTIATDVFKNVHVAVIVIAAVFSILHGDIFNFFPRFALGILLGYIFVFTKNICFSILAHLLHNFFAVGFGSMPDIADNLDEIGTFGNHFFLGIASLLILTGVIIFFIKRAKN